jgi:hypothetical protein
MCNFTPSPAMSRPDISPELARAFDELRMAVAIKYGYDPDTVEMTILRPHPSEISNSRSQIDPATNNDPRTTNNPEEFFYAQHTF